jgi:hypothetical protein
LMEHIHNNLMKLGGSLTRYKVHIIWSVSPV